MFSESHLEYLALITLEDIDTDGDLDIMFTEENYYSTDFGYVENTGTAIILNFHPHQM